MKASDMLTRAEAIKSDLANRFPQYAKAFQKTFFEINARLTRCAGRAWSNGKVEISLGFFSNDANDGEFANTITHEIAHVVARDVYTQRRIKPHGPEWQAIHRLFGGTAARCHTLELADSYASRKRTVTLPCGCGCGQSMRLGPTQAKRVQAGGRYYLKGHVPKNPLEMLALMLFK
jgi:predicted SprT family Zn-dependent metalloprotease